MKNKKPYTSKFNSIEEESDYLDKHANEHEWQECTNEFLNKIKNNSKQKEALILPIDSDILEILKRKAHQKNMQMKF
jgi:hypothetical protein